MVTTRSRGAIASPPPPIQAKPAPAKRAGDGGQNGGGQNDGGQNDAPKKKPVTKKPAAKKPAAKKPVTKKAACQKPASKKRRASELDNDNKERPAKAVRLESPPAPFRLSSPEPETPGLAALAKLCRKAFESDYYQLEEVAPLITDRKERRAYRLARNTLRAEIRGLDRDRVHKDKPRRCRHMSAAQCVRKHKHQQRREKGKRKCAAKTAEETTGAKADPSHRMLTRKNLRALNSSTATNDNKINNGNMKANPVEKTSPLANTTDKIPVPGTATQPRTRSQTPAADVATTANAEEVINVHARSNIKKPDFTMPASSLGARMPAFLAQIAAANKELEEQVAAGEKVGIEVDEEDEEEQHIEMNLGLGVLEEKKDSGSSSEEEDEDEDGEEDVMQKLRGEKGKEKEVGIQEL